MKTLLTVQASPPPLHDMKGHCSCPVVVLISHVSIQEWHTFHHRHTPGVEYTLHIPIQHITVMSPLCYIFRPLTVDLRCHFDATL